jgi:hypothetical protein
MKGRIPSVDLKMRQFENLKMKEIQIKDSSFGCSYFTPNNDSIIPIIFPGCIKTVHFLYQKRTLSYISRNYCIVNHLYANPACDWVNF